MKPLNTLILIEFEEAGETKTKSGLYVPATVDKNALGFLREGKVLAVNPKEEIVKVGDTVLFNKNAAVEVPGNKSQRLIRTEDLYAVL